MGLFSRKAEEEESTNLLGTAELPTSGDLDTELFEPDNEPLIKPAKPKPARTLSYGIEDAISLMRRLPAENREIVVSVVKQTLESTQISVEDIIADATDKEERLLNKNSQLENEIRQLQQQIAERKSQIASLLEDHKETVSVREKLELAIQLDAKQAPVARPKEAAASKPASPEPAKPAEPARPATGEPKGNNPLPH